MNERKLTPEQIDDLYKFCEVQEVKYYDVQIELVDHLAAAIEQRWEINPGFTFDEALRFEYKQFNKYDFNRICKEKEEALGKKYRKIERRYIGDFFSWPKIVATSLLTFLIYQFFFLFSNYLKFVSFTVAADILMVLFFSYLIYPRKYKVDLTANKEFLLLQLLKTRQHYFMSVGRLPGSVLMVFIFLNRDYHFGFTENPVFKVSVSLLISLSVIFFVATGIYVPKRVKADFTREFPQFIKS